MPKTNILDLPPLHETEAAGEISEEATYVVEFISELADDVTARQEAQLIADDIDAEDEALATNRLLRYERGKRDDEGFARNRCEWDDKETAKQATHMPKHLKGMRYMIDEALFENFIIRTYDVKREAGRVVLQLDNIMTKADLLAHAS